MKSRTRKAAVLFCLAMLSHSLIMAESQQERVRKPAVQGTFYAADQHELTEEVDEYLAYPPTHEVQGNIRALIAPHAGYRFSGLVAGMGFSQLPLQVTKVIILAPSHHVGMRGGGSIPDVDFYRNILGDVPVAPAAHELREKHQFFAAVPQAHEKEHSLEVMLPFLQRRYSMFSLVPIVLGHSFDASVMAQSLLPLLESETSIVIASSDLSHYKPYAEARKIDRDCLDSILSMDVNAVQGHELCGKTPVSVLMEIARLKNWQPQLIDYRNSGDTAGSKERVVGYASLAFVENGNRAEALGQAESGIENEAAPVSTSYEGQLLSPGERTLLIDLARRSIVAKLNQEELPALPNYSPTLTQQLGCFVTLNKNGKLRGCIGNILPVEPLVQAVQRQALNAAFKDNRFAPVTAAEFPEIEIEISVLTVPVELKYETADELLSLLKQGVHGVIVKKGKARVATYLPQVWEQLPRKEQFLSQLCRKGGLSPDAWKTDKDVRVEVYEAFVFHENE